MKNSSDYKKKPLVVVPGLFGSRIKVKKGICWKRAWPALTLAHLERLSMNEKGDPEYPSKVTGITGEILGTFGYGKLIKALKKHWSEKDKTLFEAPYDWRCDLMKTAAREGIVSGVPSLAGRIEEAIAVSSTDKIDIICHSQGGLAVMLYLVEDIKRFDHINRCLFLAPGFLGTVQAAKRIIYGSSFSPTSPKLEPRRAKWKTLSSNMPGIYQLMPSCFVTRHVDKFLVINNEPQTFEQSYALADSSAVTQDTIINMDILRAVGEFRQGLDKKMMRKEFLHRFRECAHIFYGVIPDSTDSRLTVTYPGRDGVPGTVESKTAGDGNVLAWGWDLFDLPPGRVCAFPCRTHMDMVQSPGVLDAAIAVLRGENPKAFPTVDYSW